LYLVLALAVPLAFVIITQNIWEDCLITLRHGKNLVEGNGLVFNAGRRIQGFTSCLNTMLLAAAYAISGRSTHLAIDFYRVVCLLAYLAAGWIVLRLILQSRNIDRLSPLLFILLYVTEAKTVAFTMNGQESALMVMFLAIGFYAAYRGFARSWKVLAVSWTGLLYTRPDAPVYIAALAVAGLIFATDDRRLARIAVAKAALVAALLFAPWFLAMWIYYGNPIPNTVLAKSNFGSGVLLDPARLIRQILMGFPDSATWVFDPINASLGGWPRPELNVYDSLCWFISVGYWLIPSRDRLGRMASFLFTLTALYMSFISVGGTVSAWYLPSVSLFATITLSRAVMQIAASLGPMHWTAALGRALQVTIVACSTLLLVAQTYQSRIQQREIEDGTRMKIGQYLHEVARPTDRVYLEPLGYIGYYADGPIMLDRPGLVAPEVVHTWKDKHEDFFGTIFDLQPEWLVLRGLPKPSPQQQEQLNAEYERVKVFDSSDKLDKYRYIPGRNYLQADSRFYVFRRK
jgi:hypothetical protein